MDRTPLTGTPSQIAAIAFSSPGAPSTMRRPGDVGRDRPDRREQHAKSRWSLHPCFLSASNTFWPSSRTPMTTSNDIEVALRSSRTRTTVPSRISRTIGSSASERAFQASQSAFTFRHHPAHRVLADRTAEQRRECSADPARLPPQRRYRRTLAKYISMRRCLHYQTALADSSAA